MKVDLKYWTHNLLTRFYCHLVICQMLFIQAARVKMHVRRTGRVGVAHGYLQYPLSESQTP